MVTRLRRGQRAHAAQGHPSDAKRRTPAWHGSRVLAVSWIRIETEKEREPAIETTVIQLSSRVSCGAHLNRNPQVPGLQSTWPQGRSTTTRTTAGGGPLTLDDRHVQYRIFFRRGHTVGRPAACRGSTPLLVPFCQMERVMSVPIWHLARPWLRGRTAPLSTEHGRSGVSRINTASRQQTITDDRKGDGDNGADPTGWSEDCRRGGGCATPHCARGGSGRSGSGPERRQECIARATGHAEHAKRCPPAIVSRRHPRRDEAKRVASRPASRR